MFRLFGTLTLLCSLTHCLGQKPVLDSTAFEDWESLQNPRISADGKIVAYSLYNRPHDSSSLIVRSPTEAWEESYVGVSNYAITSDSRYLIFFLYFEHKLGVLNLHTKSLELTQNVKSFKLLSNGSNQWVGCLLNDDSSTLNLINLTTKKQYRVADVAEFEFGGNHNPSLLKKTSHTFKGGKSHLMLVDLSDFTEKLICSVKSPSDFIFDKSGRKLAFLSSDSSEIGLGKTIFYCNLTDSSNEALLSDISIRSLGIHTIESLIKFNSQGTEIFFSLRDEKYPSRSDKAMVDVWSYKDSELQSMQLHELGQPKLYKAVVRISDKRVIQIEYENEFTAETLFSDENSQDSVCLVIKNNNDIREWNWNKSAYSICTVINLETGNRQIIDLHNINRGISYIALSPDDKFVIYFDPISNNYFNYEITTGKRLNLTNNASSEWTAWNESDWPKYSSTPMSIVGWINSNSDMIVYDRFDIFEIDPSGRKGLINLTAGNGRNHQIVFRMAIDYPILPARIGDTVIISGFDLKNKNDGFYAVRAGTTSAPKLLTTQPCVFKGLEGSEFVPVFNPIKAMDVNVFLVQQMTAKRSPNYYITSDFRNFTAVSNIHPETKYNWLTTELITWRKIDKTNAQGILYKPENFNPQKKYPVIIYYYEKLSEGLNNFLAPGYSQGQINIPYFVSNGYLVFTPDIEFRVGHPGPSVYNSVVSAAKYLKGIPYVNSEKIGIQGHSRGGFETNFLVTHTKIFTAASSACGMSDYFSLFSAVNSSGQSRSARMEMGPQRLGSTPWSHRDIFLENSPAFSADKVTTPLLILANHDDDDIPFSQGLQFFLSLRRLGKKAWLLQYDEEGHIINSPKSKKDFTLRLTQFFDYYLKDTEPPIWMTKGVRATDKGIETGYEIDKSNAKP